MRSAGRGHSAVTRAASVAGAAVLAVAIAAGVAPAASAASGDSGTSGASGPSGVSGPSGNGAAVRETANRVHAAVTPQAYAGAGAGAAAAAKPLRRVHRVRTAMSIALSPAHPYRNGRLVATGLVTQLTTKGWVHLPHAHVVLVYRPKGSSQWYWVLKGWTDRSGHYTFTTRAYGDGTWAAYLDPDSAHLYSETRKVYLRVR